MHLCMCLYRCGYVHEYAHSCVKLHVTSITAVISVDIIIHITEIFSFFNYIKTFVSCDMNIYHDMMSHTMHSLGKFAVGNIHEKNLW